MARVSALGVAALVCLVLAAALNIFLYPLSFWFRAAFFVIPVALGIYGVATGSRAFALSAGASLILVSLRPDVARDWVVIPFAVLFLAYLELAEASVRFRLSPSGAQAAYISKGGLVAAAAGALALAVYFSSPILSRVLQGPAAQAAVLDTIYLPLAAGLALFAVVYLAGVAVRG